MPNGYTRIQIALHWLIFLLIAIQFLAAEGMETAWRAVVRGTPAETLSTGALAHIVVGLSILALVVIRAAIKLRRGSPPLPEDEPKPLKLAAKMTHGGLYLLMFLVPISGSVAWFTVNENAGDAHEVLKTLLMLLIILHIIGAIFQQFVLKSDIFTRMTRPNP